MSKKNLIVIFFGFFSQASLLSVNLHLCKIWLKNSHAKLEFSQLGRGGD
ncbi:hypothetical protein HanRHA438_Chr11g0521541 [Helianthus annuus]|uniref:Uncharacterized protein n=1 Tax=Helianthus annuus TaxID=4232 RepID=A0A9K3HRW4_HELAN|nr:hypothetical protein HanXRQr2_Chr11g0509141 [Helianthus annuus]KAJ0511056.1 hypothetical protein HanIR_Chr11g0547681 [Helianthus annuus]KAJ0518809.1 hypothetical protein HanHA89_Chr11g0441581 [Helianthus annuus]KAJ0686831.1 hypothetical protein HanLR1_Chr11g0419151 [Helianthus annuus]KAJ0690637.1 hypothetical protein HanOQP8_Chr11g0420061 [Helianthus annuus]